MTSGGSDDDRQTTDAELDEVADVQNAAGGDAIRGLQRYLRTSANLNVAPLAAAFGSTEAAIEVLESLRALLHDVDVQEHDNLPHSRWAFDQLLELCRVQPTQANGNQLQEWMKLTRCSMKVRADWSPDEDPRPGTPMEATDYFVFEHETEGLIRLQWVNPLPKPGWMETGGIQCDVCLGQGLRSSYQHVNDDNERDGSSFFQHRIGWDVCAPCAANHIAKRRDGIREWVGSVQQGERVSLRRPHANGTAAPDFNLSECRFHAASTGDIELEVSVNGTGGLHAAVAVIPTSQSGLLTSLPSCWLTTGSQLLPTANVSSPQLKPSAEHDVVFRCASGDSLHITGAPVRGELTCVRKSSNAGEADSGVIHSVKAITLSEQEADFNGRSESFAFLSFPGAKQGVFLLEEDKSWILTKLHALASQAGVVHNIPLQTPLQQPKPSRCESNLSVSGSSSRTTPGVVGGYLLPPDWAGLSDCMICLDPLDQETWLRGAPLRTHCGHLFHTMCLRKFLRGHNDNGNQACPGCRSPDPLKEATHIGGNGSLQWTLRTDSSGQGFTREQCYRVVAVLCQDPQAVVDTAMVLSCAALKPEDAELGICAI